MDIGSCLLPMGPPSPKGGGGPTEGWLAYHPEKAGSPALGNRCMCTTVYHEAQRGSAKQKSRRKNLQ